MKNSTCSHCGHAFHIPPFVNVENVLCPRCNRSSRSAAAPAAWADGDLILNEFVVERKLGQGGMGTVHLVRSKFNGHRFAVKRATVQDEDRRRHFFTELVTWQNLPEHPFLAPFRFFRTVGNEIVIFTDFVNGGTLADWIAGGKLTRLQDMLDVAVQFAWGLHTAHELGVVHRDVKPGNALMTADGQLRVTDFGLARCGVGAGGRVAENIAVSSGGLTPAYASPEQSGGRPLSRQTDVWSWGVSVLDLFVGLVPACRSGTIAQRMLDAYLTSGPADARLPRMPEPLVDVLGRCFRADPAERWGDLGQVMEVLVPLYRRVAREVYPRSLFVVTPDGGENSGDASRQARGSAWSDPKVSLGAALKADGCDAGTAQAWFPPRLLSPAAQVSADLAMFDAAGRIYSRLIAAGRSDLLQEAAIVARARAITHLESRDDGGSLVAHDEAIRIYRRLIDHDGRTDLIERLAVTLREKGVALSSGGSTSAAIVAYDEAIGLIHKLRKTDGSADRAVHLACVLNRKAKALASLGDERGAVAVLDEAIGILRRFVERDGRTELTGERPGEVVGELAVALLQKGSSLNSVVDSQTAMAALDECVVILRGLIEHKGRIDLRGVFADAKWYKGDALRQTGDVRGAVAVYDEAIGILRQLTGEQGLAKVLLSKARALLMLRDPQTAVQACDEATRILRRMVDQRGRSDLIVNLLLAMKIKGMAQIEQRDLSSAVVTHDEAIRICRRLAERMGEDGTSSLAVALQSMAVLRCKQSDLAAAVAAFDESIAIYRRLAASAEQHDPQLAPGGKRTLATALVNKGTSIAELNDHRGAVAAYDEAVTIYRQSMGRDGGADLATDLAKVRLHRAYSLLGLGKRELAAGEAREAIPVIRKEAARLQQKGLREFLASAEAAFRDVL